MSTSIERVRFIQGHYFLVQEKDGKWCAYSLRRDGTVFSRIEGTDKCEVISDARRQWGHFNFEDEAEAFAKIFPPQSGYRVEGKSMRTVRP